MFRITEDPSSGSLVQCLAKNYKNDSIVSVDMVRVGVMAAMKNRREHYTLPHSNVVCQQLTLSTGGKKFTHAH